MDEIRVVLNEAAPARGDDLAVRLVGPDPTFTLRIDHIERRLSSRLDDLSLDLIEIAAAVFAADSSTRRGGRVRRNFGADWRRRFRFLCPVRSIAFWSRADVRDALSAAVSFLTDDDVSFEFVEARHAPPAEAYLPFDAATDQTMHADQVLLFSGGLDSLTGAIEVLSRTTGPIALVSHRSAPKIARRQKDLARELSDRFPGRLRWFPVEATRKGSEASDITQRSRSLLFAALGFAAARMLSARRVVFFENGVVSANLPLARQIIGTMATRTTHPLALRLLEDLLGKLPGESPRLDNPYGWLTKTEVIARLAETGHADLIASTISCTNVYPRTNRLTHCGACSQCLDRRFALIAAGMADREDPTCYQTEVMTGARDNDLSRTLALEWTRHALEMPVDEIGFYEKFGSELPRLVDGVRDRSEIKAVHDLVDLHRRHSASVRQALHASFQASGSALIAGEVPPTALLRMLASRSDEAPALPIATPAEPRVSEATKRQLARAPVAGASDVWPAQIVVDREPPGARLRVLDLMDIDGSPARLILALRSNHAEDLAAGLPRERWRYTSAQVLADALGVDEPNLRQVVKRLRTELKEALEAADVESDEQDPLIQNKPKHGYRLDPLARFVRAADA